MSMSPMVVLWLIALAGGLSAALAGLLLSRLIAEVPAEDRSYRDRPPAVFRIAWWPIQWCAHYLGAVLPAAYRMALQRRLRLAGLDYALTAEQYVAARVVLAGLGFAVARWIPSAYGPGGAATWGMAGAVLGAALPAVWLRDRVQARRHESLKALPFFLDLVTLCVEAGLNLTGALQQAVSKGPDGPLRTELSRVLRDVRAGRPRADALRSLSERMNEPAITHLVTALIQAEQTGMNLGPILRAQAEQRRLERFARAEKAAMEAPVKLLLPLLFFIFPCVFLVIGFPIAMRFLQMGG